MDPRGSEGRANRRPTVVLPSRRVSRAAPPIGVSGSTWYVVYSSTPSIRTGKVGENGQSFHGGTAKFRGDQTVGCY